MLKMEPETAYFWFHIYSFQVDCLLFVMFFFNENWFNYNILICFINYKSSLVSCMCQDEGQTRFKACPLFVSEVPECLQKPAMLFLLPYMKFIFLWLNSNALCWNVICHDTWIFRSSFPFIFFKEKLNQNLEIKCWHA